MLAHHESVLPCAVKNSLCHQTPARSLAQTLLDVLHKARLRHYMSYARTQIQSSHTHHTEERNLSPHRSLDCGARRTPHSACRSSGRSRWSYSWSPSAARGWCHQKRRSWRSITPAPSFCGGGNGRTGTAAPRNLPQSSACFNLMMTVVLASNAYIFVQTSPDDCARKSQACMVLTPGVP